MPKLLFINATLNWGSTGKIVEQVGLLSREKGWDCYVAHGARYTRHSELKTIRIGGRLSEWLHAALSILTGKNGHGSYNATKCLIKRIKQIGPDIIHLHNIHGYYINYKLLFDFLRDSHIPIVWTMHDCWAITGHCTHFDSIGCNKWETGCHNCPLLGVSYKSLFDRSLKNYDEKRLAFTSVDRMYLVPVSNWLKSVFERSFLRDYPIKTITNGIDLSIFTPSVKQALNENGTIKVLGVASRWNDRKGLSEFIRLSENPRFRITLIGVSKSQQKKLPRSIRAILRTNNVAELVDEYRAADVFVNPTYNDSFPTVNIESLACGTPVVTYNTGGSPEIIDIKTGRVVEKGAFNLLVSAIYDQVREIQTNPQIIAYNCRRRAELLFDKRERFLDYISLYNKIIDNGK